MREFEKLVTIGTAGTSTGADEFFLSRFFRNVRQPQTQFLYSYVNFIYFHFIFFHFIFAIATFWNRRQRGGVIIMVIIIEIYTIICMYYL